MGVETAKPGPWDSHGSQVSGTLHAHAAQVHWATSSQICALSAATGKAFTTVLAGLAFTFISWPKAILTPALVAGFTRVLILQSPGMVKMPAFFTSAVARVARLARRPDITLVLISCCSASALTRAPSN